MQPTFKLYYGTQNKDVQQTVDALFNATTFKEFMDVVESLKGRWKDSVGSTKMFSMFFYDVQSGLIKKGLRLRSAVPEELHQHKNIAARLADAFGRVVHSRSNFSLAHYEFTKYLREKEELQATIKKYEEFKRHLNTDNPGIPADF